MAPTRPIARLAGVVAAALLAGATPASAQRTDVVQIVNGDKLTGEIKLLDRGTLTLKTNDLGTISIKWDRVARLIASRLFEVETTIGLTYLGSLAAADLGQVTVTTGGSAVTLALLDIVRIAPIGQTFWSQLEGHLDVGFSYTRSSEVLQFNLDHATKWVRPSFNVTLEVQSALTKQPDTSDTGRSMLRAYYARQRGARWLVGGGAQFDRNTDQGIDLRAAGLVGVARVLITTHTVDSTINVGLSVNEEYPVDAPKRTNVEASGNYVFSYFTHHSPKTGFDLNGRLLPSLSDLGRARFEISTSVRRELFRDFTVTLSFYDTFDSRPPTEEALKNDYGVVTSVGWVF